MVSQEIKTYCTRFVRKLILRGRAAEAEEIAADDDGLQVGLDDEAFAEFLGDDHRLDRAAAEAARPPHVLE